MKILSPAFPILAKLVNRYLKLDPETMSRIAALQNKVIEISLTDLNINCFILFKQNEIDLLSDYKESVDCHISGKSFALLNMLCKNKNSSEDTVNITGDVELAQEFNAIMAKIDIDWEEQLSKLTGDVAAHRIAHSGRKIFNWLEQSRNKLCENVSEFLREEKRYVVSKEELDDFCEDVTQLQNDVERAEQRVARLLKNKQPEVKRESN